MADATTRVGDVYVSIDARISDVPAAVSRRNTLITSDGFTLVSDDNKTLLAKEPPVA